MTDLNPCPFCGGEAVIRQSPQTRSFGAHCLGVGCIMGVNIMPAFATRDSAVYAWNTRAPAQPVKEMTEDIYICANCGCPTQEERWTWEKYLSCCPERKPERRALAAAGVVRVKEGK